ILPWKDRDFGMNLAPHGWFAAEYRILLRNMMVREQSDTLHLLSAISPNWVKKDAKIDIKKAPTEFGEVNFTLTFKKNSATLVLKNNFKKAPAVIILHLPWFMEVRKIEIDGRSINQENNAVSLPVDTRQVDLEWSFKKNIENMSYDQTVEQYKSEYRRRYEKFIREGD
ncbi:MAG TPA: hypothetical protein PLI55_00810, partial [Candidatus Marinimicrobia bacterium]|nr:hypothetical protein [Candidatus Neomarinimicrobiota bacterium]